MESEGIIMAKWAATGETMMVDFYRYWLFLSMNIPLILDWCETGHTIDASGLAWYLALFVFLSYQAHW